LSLKACKITRLKAKQQP